MGGKSTLLRQTCLSVIVAQMVRFRPSMRDVVAQC
jgi:DNA mismatch repair ATPase MutS